jgi:hypothetical protein
MRRRGALIAVAGLVLAACSSPTMAPSASSSVVTTPSALAPTPPAPASPTAIPSASPSIPGTATPATTTGPTAARPYDAADVLAAMASSRRPGGIPQQLQTMPIAVGIASQVWTYDGAPWPAITTGGSCGPQTCTLDVSGIPDDGAGEDLYTFSITPADATVELLVADLHGYPAALEGELDAIARAGVDPDRLAGLDLVGARWLAPPRDGQFVLSYRSGGEEGSPALDVTVDQRTRRVLDVARPTGG